MTWWTATSVSVNSGATIVNVNTGDDVQIAQEAGGLVIGNQPPVEIKRTFLDGGGLPKIELRLPWPHANQTTQPAVAFPTDADLAEATRVLRSVGSDAVTFAEALSQVLSSTANTITIQTETSGDVTVVPYGRLTQQVQTLLNTFGDFGVPLYDTDTKNQARTLLGLQPQVTAQPTLDLDFTNNEHRVYEPFGLTRKTLTEAITTTRASSATYNSPFGIASAAANISRIEYDPITGECLGLLCEEQRTNLALNSEVMTASTGTVLVSSNSVIAPDGAMTANVIGETAVNSEHYAADRVIAMTAGQVYTWSCYIKRISGSLSRFLLRVATNAFSTRVFNIDSADFSDSSGGMISLPNGWKRCWMVTPPATTTGAGVCRLQFMPQSGSDRVYEGNPNEQFALWGVQLEAGSPPTSYIKTEGSQVTRVQDVNELSMFNRVNLSEGTLFFDYECKFTGIAEPLFLLSGGGANLIIRNKPNGDGKLNLLITGASGGGFDSFNNNTTVSLPLVGKNKLAVIYKAGSDYKVCVNGVIGLVASNRSPALPREILTNTALSLLGSSSNAGRTAFGFIRYLPRALSDQELIDLTRI